MGKKVAIVVGVLFAVVSYGTCSYDAAPPEHASSVADDPCPDCVKAPSSDANWAVGEPSPTAAPTTAAPAEGAEGSEGYGQGYGSAPLPPPRARRSARRPASDPLAGLEDPPAGDGDGSVVIEEPGGILSLVDHVLSKLAVGNIAFNTPERMGIQETETVELLLSTKESTEQLAAEVKGRPVATAEGVRVAPEMEADLKGQGFKIEAVTPSKQVVSNLQRTRWAWTVTAIKDGKQNLDLSLSARIQVQGKDSPFVVKTFTKTIEVQVDIWGKIVALMKEHGQWLWTTVLVPAWLWWRNRKKKATTLGPPSQGS